MMSQPDLGNNGNKKQETRNILTREKKTGTDFQSFSCFCCNQLVVLDGCNLGWEGRRCAGDCWSQWWWKFSDTTQVLVHADSRLKSLMIRNNYPGMYQSPGITQAPSTRASSRVLSRLFLLSLHPQSVITVLMRVCLSSSGSWLIIWSPTHYQTQTSSLLFSEASDCSQRNKCLYFAFCMLQQ